MCALHRLAAPLPADPVRVMPVGGGCICAAYRVELADGRTVFVKERADAPEGFFDTEAAGLRWLAGAGPAAAPTPGVVSVHPQALVLDWVAAGAATPAAAEQFGRALAATHAAGAASFGGPRDGWIGSAPLSNTPADTWAQFYARERVLPYLREAADRRAIAASDAQAVETVIARIDDLGGPAEPPARIHGDLWSGNVHWAADGRAWLVDPAAHGGHRETDLAMLALFGAPHLDRILAAYDEADPLADGWQQRVALHQLHPLLVHAVLFGGGYGAQAGARARRTLSAS
ncbi:MAG: fructosamine kinase family protein [Frankiaceae bacterium]